MKVTFDNKQFNINTLMMLTGKQMDLNTGPPAPASGGLTKTVIAMCQKKVLFVSISDIATIFDVSRQTAYRMKKRIILGCAEKDITVQEFPGGRLLARHVKTGLGLSDEDWKIAEEKIWDSQHKK